MLAWSFLFTVEGIPLIYYGDEIGLPGAGDPDNRRMMVWGGWSSNNTMVYDHVSQLASVRRTIPALRRGTTEVLYTDDSVMAYRRAHTSGDAIVVINRGNTGISVPLGLSGSWTDALTESNFTGDVLVPGYGTLILTQ
jgi:glycosidase